MISNSSMKSPRCIGSSLASAARRERSSSARIISRTAWMRSSSKNMCSVRQSPMPSAPNLTASRASAGVSALARTPSARTLSAQPISVPNSPDSAGSIIGTRPASTWPVEPSMVMISPRLSTVLPACMVCARVVDAERAGAGDAGLAHAARHHGGVRGHAAARGEDAFGGVHAVDVLGRGLDPHQDHLLAVGLELRRLVGGEHDLAGGRAGRGRQAGRDHLALGVGIDGRVQQLVERGRIDARHRLLPGDQLLVGKLDRDAQRRLGGALAVARLQHPQLALLDRELEVLHVAVVPLERAVDAGQLLERVRHRALHRRLVGAGLLARGLGDLLRRADAGDHVLALGVDQELAVEPLLAGRGIAREGDAGRRGLAHVAEHHGLHVDRGAPAFRDVVQAAIGDGALVHPRAEHRADRAPQLLRAGPAGTACRCSSSTRSL